MSETVKCKCIRSTNNPFERCQRVAHKNGLCKSHEKQKKIIIFDPQILNPIYSENDTDPVSLEKIYEDNGKAKKLCQKPSMLFTYKMTSGNKVYQRTLQLTSLQNLINNNILRDPFSNEPFTADVLENARREISRLPKTRNRTKIEEQKIRMNSILDKFQRIGYLINPLWVSSKRKNFFIAWINEVNVLWLNFRHDNPNLSHVVYNSSVMENINFTVSAPDVIANITTRLLEFMAHSLMGDMIVLSALAWISEEVKRAYPDLISF
jgi:hypothetical protein